LGAVQMLVHINQRTVAEKVHNAWLKTLEDGIHTYDIFKEGVSKEKVGTKEFAQAVIARLGQKPTQLTHVNYDTAHVMNLKPYVRRAPAKKEIVGVDIFVHHAGTAEEVANKAKDIIAEGKLALTMISNRGLSVWPTGFPETFLTDHWRLRCKPKNAGETITHSEIAQTLTRLANAGVDFIKTEHLIRFDGKDAFSLGQGQ